MKTVFYNLIVKDIYIYICTYLISARIEELIKSCEITIYIDSDYQRTIRLISSVRFLF
jgi:hypothetical protein